MPLPAWHAAMPLPCTADGTHTACLVGGALPAIHYCRCLPNTTCLALILGDRSTVTVHHLARYARARWNHWEVPCRLHDRVVGAACLGRGSRLRNAPPESAGTRGGGPGTEVLLPATTGLGWGGMGRACLRAYRCAPVVGGRRWEGGVAPGVWGAAPWWVFIPCGVLWAHHACLENSSGRQWWATYLRLPPGAGGRTTTCDAGALCTHTIWVWALRAAEWKAVLPAGGPEAGASWRAAVLPLEERLESGVLPFSLPACLGRGALATRLPWQTAGGCCSW